MKRTIILSLLILCSAAMADAETYKGTDDQGMSKALHKTGATAPGIVAAPESGRSTPVQNRAEKLIAYTAKDYARLIGMAGFSEAMLKNHFTLYQGYVTNTKSCSIPSGRC